MEEAKVSLKEHILALFQAHREAHTALHDSIELAREGVDTRLTDLNNLRRDVLTDRAAFLTIAVYEVKHEAIRIAMDAGDREVRQEVEAILDRLQTKVDDLTEFKSRFLPLLTLTAALAALAGGLLIFIIERFLGLH